LTRVPGEGNLLVGTPAILWEARVKGVISSGCIALLLVSCSTAELEKEINETFERSKTTSYREGERLPWAVGQWALFRITETHSETFFRAFSGEARGIREYAITGTEGTAFWLEVREVWPDEETRCAFLVDHVDPKRMQDLRVIRIKLLDSDGEVLEFGEGEDPPSEVQELQYKWVAVAKAFHLSEGTGRVRPLAVPAGRFEESFAVPVSVSVLTGSTAGSIWFTNAVPIFYSARQFSLRTSWVWAQASVLYDLVDFGTEGAKSFFSQDDRKKTAQAGERAGGEKT
jgi:hypothetical protein